MSWHKPHSRSVKSRSPKYKRVDQNTIEIDGIRYSQYSWPHDGRKFKVGLSGSGYTMVFGSDTRNPGGTKHVQLKEGDIIYFDSQAPDGTLWFYKDGDRGYISGISGYADTFGYFKKNLHEVQY